MPNGCSGNISFRHLVKLTVLGFFPLNLNLNEAVLELQSGEDCELPPRVCSEEVWQKKICIQLNDTQAKSLYLPCVMEQNTEEE